MNTRDRGTWTRRAALRRALAIAAISFAPCGLLADCNLIVGLHDVADGDAGPASYDGGGTPEGGNSTVGAASSSASRKDAGTEAATMGAQEAASPEASRDASDGSMPNDATMRSDSAPTQDAASDVQMTPPAQLVLSTAPLTATAGAPLVGQFASITDTLATEVSSNLTASITWGDGTTSFGAISGGPGTFAVSSSHVYASPGSAVVSMRVTSSTTGAVATATANVTIRGTPIFREFSVPLECYPQDIVSGPSGLLWFTEANCGVAKCSPSGDVQTAYTAPVGAGPFGIAPSGSGDIWFTELQNASLGDIQGFFPVAIVPAEPDSRPLQIVRGNDGNMWFADGTGRIGRVTLDGSVEEYPIPSPSASYAPSPQGVALGSDGRVWYADTAGMNVLNGPFRVGAVATDGGVTVYVVPSFHAPKYITLGPDGALWFTEFGDALGRVTTTGAFTEYAVPEGEELTTGPDGNLWITDFYGNAVGYVTP